VAASGDRANLGIANVKIVAKTLKQRTNLSKLIGPVLSSTFYRRLRPVISGGFS
jgi:hypothetical protein